MPEAVIARVVSDVLMGAEREKSSAEATPAAVAARTTRERRLMVLVSFGILFLLYGLVSKIPFIYLSQRILMVPSCVNNDYKWLWYEIIMAINAAIPKCWIASKSTMFSLSNNPIRERSRPVVKSVHNVCFRGNSIFGDDV